ncbi:hypothetical protein [Xanthobacter tagetidis]|uniref:Uncharacterized protein n=1 Tax=Xanthobacter tagetidis TaxID=60216 RepID=A0A3L7A5J7_9HYPH|nr:hypothetical protein D9R14_18145 [Xanthobacter tagetidis]
MALPNTPDAGAATGSIRAIRLRGWLRQAVARLRRAKAISASREFPAGRWCDHVERAINAQIIHGDPRKL